MEHNISPVGILCIVLVSLALVIGIGYGAFAITKGSANEGTQEVASQTSYASNSWKDTYNDSEVTGAQALTLLNEANSKGIAVFVNTRGMCGSTIKAPAEVPVLKHNGKYYMNYGTVFDYEDESYKKASGDITYGDNSGLLQVRDGSSLKVDCNPKLNNGRLVKNEDYTGLYANGSINFVDTHAKFKSNLIYGADGEVVGVILSQVNRSGYSSLPLSSGGGSTSSGSNNSGNSNQKPNFSNNVSYGNIPVTPNWTTGGGSSSDDDSTGDSSTEGGSSGGEVTPPEEKAYFYIDSVIYEAPSYATTWSEWIESENNTIGIKVLDGYLVTDDYKIINTTTTHKPVAVNDSVTNCKRYVSEVEVLKFTLYEYNTYGDVLSLDYESNMTWEDYINSSYNKTTSYAGNKAFQLVKGSGWLANISVRYYDFSVTMGHMLGLIGGSNYILGTGNNNSSVYYQGFAPSDGIPRGPKTETFNIGSVTYEFFDRENWWHWVDSRFNTCGATILADGKISIGGKIVQYNGNDVIYTDEIGSGKTYTTRSDEKSFTLVYWDGASKEYSFDSGMTWSEWVESAYDETNMFGISSTGQVFDNTIMNGNYYYISGVSSGDLIEDGVTYTQVKSNTLKLFAVGLVLKNVIYEDGMTFFDWYHSDYNVYSDVSCASLATNFYVNNKKIYDNVDTCIYGYSVIKPLTYFIYGNFPPPAMKLHFTIDSSSYDFDCDLMWKEWVYSSDNTGGFKISGGYLVTSGGNFVLNSSGNKVLPTDKLQSGGVYSSKTLISFTIKSDEPSNFSGLIVVPYQAEEGMTWGEWLNSSYNDDDVSARTGVIDGITYMRAGMNYIKEINNHTNGIVVKESDVIKGGVDYYVGSPTLSFYIGTDLYSTVCGITWEDWIEHNRFASNFVITSDGRIQDTSKTDGVYVVKGQTKFDRIGYNEHYELLKLVSFEIRNTESSLPDIARSTFLLAEDGMTWREWVESDYDTFGASIWTIMGYESVRYDADGAVALSSGRSTSGVAPDDTLVNGAVYYLWDTSD